MHRVSSAAGLLLVVLASSCSTEAKICGRMETLCGTSRHDCAELVRSTKESFGEEGVDGLKSCFADAQSCREAGGCVAGKGLKNLGNALGDLLKGLSKGLDDTK